MYIGFSEIPHFSHKCPMSSAHRQQKQLRKMSRAQRTLRCVLSEVWRNRDRNMWKSCGLLQAHRLQECKEFRWDTKRSKHVPPPLLELCNFPRAIKIDALTELHNFRNACAKLNMKHERLTLDQFSQTWFLLSLSFSCNPCFMQATSPHCISEEFGTSTNYQLEVCSTRGFLFVVCKACQRCDKPTKSHPAS